MGLYQKAIEDFDIDLSESWTIGDKLRDSQICETTNCRGFLISDLEKTNIIDVVKRGNIRNIEYANDLYDAAKMIVNRSIC